MFHCKQIIIDDLFASIGSSNIDNRSFRLNDEANLNVLDAAFAREQQQIFSTDKSRAKEITYDLWKHRGPFEALLDQFFSTAGYEM